MEIIIAGTNVAEFQVQQAGACVQHYQDGCGSYCNCDCNGDH